MITFFNHRITHADSAITLKADYMYEPTHNEDETFSFSAPKCWKAEVAKIIDPNVCNVYRIYTLSVPRANISRITNYKKIWGLGGISKGEYDNFFDTPTARIYVGFAKIHVTEEIDLPVKSLIVVTPKTESLSCDEIFTSLSLSGFFEGNSEEQLKIFFNHLRESLVVYYEIMEYAQLTILGKDTATLFSQISNMSQGTELCVSEQ